MLEFAIVPDGAPAPTAIFTDVEAAIVWGLRRYGSGCFVIRRARHAEIVPAAERPAPRD